MHHWSLYIVSSKHNFRTFINIWRRDLHIYTDFITIKLTTLSKKKRHNVCKALFRYDVAKRYVFYDDIKCNTHNMSLSYTTELSELCRTFVAQLPFIYMFKEKAVFFCIVSDRALKLDCTTCIYLRPLYSQQCLSGTHWSRMIPFFLC